MKEWQYCVVRLGGNFNGEVLYIGDSEDECRKAAGGFKREGIACKVHSYDEIKQFDKLNAYAYK